MVKAGINVIRMGEHTWGLCEPEEGQYDFTWLRRVMNVMAEREIKVVLATPTAAPPPGWRKNILKSCRWMSRAWSSMKAPAAPSV